MAHSGPALRGSGSGFSELKQRLLFVFIAIVIFRAGSFVPVPGIDSIALADLVKSQQDTLLALFNMFSGGSLARASILSLGIMPYITESIIIQILSFVDPRLEAIKKEGEAGRRKINQYTRYLTLLLATVQAIGLAIGLPQQFPNIVQNPDVAFYIVAVVSLVTGTMFVMWLGEQINERGIGNGISLLIFVGIVAGLPSAISDTLGQAKTGQIEVFTLFLIGFLVIGVTYFVVFVEQGQRRIVVNYAKRQQGRKMYAAQSSHLPLKVNMAGVIPAIFASSIILFPSTLGSWFGESAPSLQKFASYMAPGEPLYIVLYAAGIIFFCYFYTALVFNPRDTADNLKRSGAFIPGVRPGEQTSRYIDKVMTRLTTVGAAYITFVCLVPEFLRAGLSVNFYFGGTSLLIIVVVIMDFMAQVRSHLLSSQYESVMKKANFRGGLGGV